MTMEFGVGKKNKLHLIVSFFSGLVVGHTEP